jgi:hypothetical protein
MYEEIDEDRDRRQGKRGPEKSAHHDGQA